MNVTRKPMTAEYREICIRAVLTARHNEIAEVLKKYQTLAELMTAEIEAVNARYDDALLGIPQVGE